MHVVEEFVRRLFRVRLVRHLFFWGLVLLTSYSFYFMYYQEVDKSLLRIAFRIPTIVIAAYLLVYYQIPKLVYKQRYVAFFIHFLFSAYILSIIARAVNIYLFEPFVMPPGFEQESAWEIMTDSIAIYKSYFLEVYATAFVMAILKLIKERFEERQKQQKLEKEKLVAELNFLRAQVHPHFLFNTLNNLYLLTLKKSDKAPEIVIKLSEILDYMLYQCNEPFVPIEKEIKLIENYIGLEMLRYGNRLELTFDKTIDNYQKKIAPLLLLSLVENAFKHGASGDIGEPRIEIGVILVEESLSIRVFNTKSKLKQTDEQGYKKGIGVSNTKRQLELLYPNKHELVIEEESESYMVNLFIDLNTETE